MKDVSVPFILCLNETVNIVKELLCICVAIRVDQQQYI